MISIEEARERILETVVPMPPERVELVEALGRRAAREVASPMDVPPWANSAMDGYAVRADEAAAGARLKLQGVVGAGSVGEPLEPGHATAIMTGAPLPPGADAVVIVEDTDGATEGAVTVHEGVDRGANVRPAGQDVRSGSVLVARGERLTPGKLGMLASVGCTHVQVSARPRVGILSTGSEIVRPGRPLGPGQIYSSNPVALTCWTREVGAAPVDLGDAPDDLQALIEQIELGLANDVLVTTGGVSVGRFDLVKQAFEALGIPILFWKVRMKPGKPLAFGVIERDGRNVPVFGLPGNPVSCQVNFCMFVAPWLRASMGAVHPLPAEIKATALETFVERPGRAKLLRVRLEPHGHGFGVRSTGSQSSGVGSSMARAHGLMRIAPERGTVEQGAEVEVIVIDPAALG